MAAQIQAVQCAAYRQEAKLLGVTDFPPLNMRVEDIVASEDLFLGAVAGEELFGVISLEPRSKTEGLISSLTVVPGAQRRGIGRALVAAASRAGYVKLSVSTAVDNAPALALYQQLGFVEVLRRRVGPENLQLVELCAESSNISVNADVRERASVQSRYESIAPCSSEHVASRGRRLP